MQGAYSIFFPLIFHSISCPLQKKEFANTVNLKMHSLLRGGVWKFRIFDKGNENENLLIPEMPQALTLTFGAKQLLS